MRLTRPPRRALPLLLGAALTITLTQNGFANDREARYEGSGARVVRAAGITLVDEGSMTCSATTGLGNGGTCLRFNPAVPDPAVFVLDDALGPQVPFQVCVDNNGDGFCTSPEEGPCADDIVFSHADGGAFFNPLSVRGGFRPGCPGGAYAGYIVFLCNGVHVDATAHTHGGTTGIARLVTASSGSGNFCGGTQQNVSRKKYTITP